MAVQIAFTDRTRADKTYADEQVSKTERHEYQYEVLRDAVLALYRGVHTLNRKGESTEVRWEEVALLGPTAWFGVTGNRINR
ncbi:hypothetical protein B6E66_34065 [Streptomyces maremycinicus]|nr:hypothetical protein B6E66_34065 [Streptomyces sp. B9173]